MKRIILTIHADGTATAKGLFIDARESVNSLNRTYKTEAQALQDFTEMRDRDCEFSFTVSRKV